MSLDLSAQSFLKKMEIRIRNTWVEPSMMIDSTICLYNKITEAFSKYVASHRLLIEAKIKFPFPN